MNAQFEGLAASVANRSNSFNQEGCTMNAQFDCLFHSFMHTSFKTLDITSHLSSEEAIVHYVNNVIKSMGVFTFSPEVERSVKSGEYFKYYAVELEELTKKGDFKEALLSVNDVIRNVVRTEELVELLVRRVILLALLDCYYEMRSDLRLITLLVEQPPKGVKKLLDLLEKDPMTSRYSDILRHFPQIQTLTITPELADKLNSMIERSERRLGSSSKQSVPAEGVGHNKSRKCIPLSVEEPWLATSEEAPVTEACVSSALSVEDSQARGRHVVATRNIEIGEVLIGEAAHVKCLLDNRRLSHCSLCFDPCLAPLPCPLCPDVVFCSEQCMSDDTAHQIECGYVSELSSLPKMVYLALRTITSSPSTLQQWATNANTPKSYSDVIKTSNTAKAPSTAFNNTINLITNFSLRAPCDVLKRTCQAIYLTNFLKSVKVFESVCSGDVECYYTASAVVMLKTLQSYPCNAHEISEFQYDPKNLRLSMNEDIGAGAFPFLSLINHSCDPNVVRHSFGTKTIVRALRSIKKGEEILDNYGYHYATHGRKDRRKALKSQYYFTCNCDSCEDSWPLFTEISSDIKFKCNHCQKALESKAMKLKCCGINYSKLIHDNKLIVERARQSVRKLVSGDTGVKEHAFTDLLVFADEYVVRPWRLYNECQEALKQLYNLSSNQRLVSLQ